MAGFETPLTGVSATPDVSIRATRADFQAITNTIGSSRPGRALGLLVELCERNSDHWYFGQLSDVWLEFDAQPSDSFSAPSIFFATSKANAFSLGMGPACPSLLRTLLSRLTDAPVGDAHGRALDRCFSALGERDFVGQVGCMLGRGVHGTRLLIEATDPLAYLHRLPLPIDVDAIGELLRPHASSVDKFLVSLDVDGDILPRVGLEFIVAATGAQNRERWTPILQRWSTKVYPNDCAPRPCCAGAARSPCPGLAHAAATSWLA